MAEAVHAFNGNFMYLLRQAASFNVWRDQPRGPRKRPFLLGARQLLLHPHVLHVLDPSPAWACQSSVYKVAWAAAELR